MMGYVAETLSNKQYGRLGCLLTEILKLFFVLELLLTIRSNILFLLGYVCCQWWVYGWEARGKAENGTADDVILFSQS